MENIDLKLVTPLTDFRNNIKRYMEELSTHKKPIVLTQHGKSAAVVIDAEKYQEMQDQIEFMRKVAIGLEDYREQRLVPASKVFDEIDKILSLPRKR